MTAWSANISRRGPGNRRSLRFGRDDKVMECGFHREWLLVRGCRLAFFNAAGEETAERRARLQRAAMLPVILAGVGPAGGNYAVANVDLRFPGLLLEIVLSFGPIAYRGKDRKGLRPIVFNPTWGLGL
jgi:hypothetical protein